MSRTFITVETHPGEWRLCEDREGELVHLCRGGHTLESAARVENEDKRGHHHETEEAAAACVGANNARALLEKSDRRFGAGTSAVERPDAEPSTHDSETLFVVEKIEVSPEEDAVVEVSLDGPGESEEDAPTE